MQYPDTLPLPDHGSYAGVGDAGLVRTSLPTPAANQIETYNSERIDITMTFSMDMFTYPTWLTWILDNGYDWFEMPVISQRMPIDILSTSRVRVTSDTNLVKRGHNWISVTLGMELIPGDTPIGSPGITWPNFIYANTPTTAPADSIVAGTPTSPSADLIRAGLYDYEV